MSRGPSALPFVPKPGTGIKTDSEAYLSVLKRELTVGIHRSEGYRHCFARVFFVAGQFGKACGNIVQGPELQTFEYAAILKRTTEKINRTLGTRLWIPTIMLPMLSPDVSISGIYLGIDDNNFFYCGPRAPLQPTNLDQRLQATPVRIRH